MAKLPIISGAEAIKAFKKAGWTQDRQKGSHVVLVKPDYRFVLTVPLHPELDRGTLRALIRAAGLTVDEFCDLL